MSNRYQNKHLWVVAGPTASGKTGFAIELAQRFHCEIINFDSRQFYGDLKIGAALPSDEELSLVKHHFIGNRALDETYSAGQFAVDAQLKAEELWQINDHLVAVGGSGLYLKAWLEGLDEFPEVPMEVRDQLNAQFQANGIEFLQNLLADLDPIWHQQVALKNPQRLIRALEICIASGKPYSSFLGKKTKENQIFKTIKLALQWPRDELYERIHHRADLMKEMGFLDEAKKVYAFKGHYALNTVGYKELFDFIEGKTNEIEAWNLIKQNTRRYAKRQITWFKADSELQWFDAKNIDIDEFINNNLK